MIFLGNPRSIVLAEARRHMTDKAVESWVGTPNSGLGGMTPNALIDDPMGARMVLQVLDNPGSDKQ